MPSKRPPGRRKGGLRHAPKARAAPARTDTSAKATPAQAFRREATPTPPASIVESLVDDALLSFDTDRIKEYVFASGALRDVRGASALLDRLNRALMPQVVRDVAPSATVVYAHGGSGLFRVPFTQAQEARQAVERLYADRTHAASITGATLQLPEGVSSSSPIAGEFRLLAYRLPAAKDRPPVYVAEEGHSLLRPCDVCGQRSSVAPWSEPGETEQSRRLCQSCFCKRREDQQIKASISGWLESPAPARASDPLWRRLIASLRDEGYPLGQVRDRPVDFDDIGELSRPQGYLGLIYADGDGMGKLLESLRTLDEFRDFSHTVDHAAYKAMVAAARRYLAPFPGISHFPFDVLLLGGDDVVLVVPAHLAIPVACTLVQEFSAQAAWNIPLRLSASVVIAHDTFPFATMYDLATSGLKFAKQEAARRASLASGAARTGLINFQVVTASNQLDFGRHRQSSLRSALPGGGDSWLDRTLRPYAPEDLLQLVRTARTLANAPRTKLEQVRAATFLDHANGRIAALTALLHWDSQGERQALVGLLDYFASGGKQQFPWFQRGEDWATPFVDLLELFDFLPAEPIDAGR